MVIITWLTVSPMPWAINGWPKTIVLEIKSIGHGMEPKVFWGIILCQGRREIPGCFISGHLLHALILMGAWCEAVRWWICFATKKIKKKKRVRKQSQVASSWWYKTKRWVFCNRRGVSSWQGPFNGCHSSQSPSEQFYCRLLLRLSKKSKFTFLWFLRIVKSNSCKAKNEGFRVFRQSPS